MFYWFLKTVVLGPILKLLFRPWVEGAEHVPAHGAAILASNHLSFSDSIFLPIVLSRRITFPAKMEYFTGSGVKGRLTAWFFKGVGPVSYTHLDVYKRQVLTVVKAISPETLEKIADVVDLLSDGLRGFAASRRSEAPGTQARTMPTPSESSQE